MRSAIHPIAAWRRVAAAVSTAAALLGTPAFAFEVGEPAGELTVVDRSGRPIVAGAAGGHVVVLDFWASWCAPCRPALESLDGLARRYAEANLTVLAVSADRDRDDAEAFIEEHFAGSPIVFAYDPGRRLLAGSDAGGLPATFLIGQDGVVRWAGSGWTPAKAAALEREVAALLGRPRKSLDPALLGETPD